jgi:hypothetical protein
MNLKLTWLTIELPKLSYKLIYLRDAMKQGALYAQFGEDKILLA